MKNCNDTIGNRTRDLPNCSAVPQTTAPPRIPVRNMYLDETLSRCLSCEQLTVPSEVYIKGDEVLYAYFLI